MAATMFFPPPSMPTANPDHLPDEISDDDDEVADDIIVHHHHHQMHHDHHTNETEDTIDHHMHHTNVSDDTIHLQMHHDHHTDADDNDTIPHHLLLQANTTEDHQVNNQQDLVPTAPGETSVLPEVVTVEDEDEEQSNEEPQDETLPPTNVIEVSTGSGVDIGTLIGRRVTLKPRRTLSLSPTPARAGDMMARNLRAATWLDFTNQDDDDGLYQPSDSESEGKRKTMKEEKSIGRVLVTPRRGRSLGSLTVGAAMTGVGFCREVFTSRRGSSSMKRPLEITLPCQEIQYLDISYQKVGIHAVQFSPIPRKKIAYHPVPYHAIHYCDVPYLGERPVKRKPPA